jgi:hypothetical protein
VHNSILKRLRGVNAELLVRMEKFFDLKMVFSSDSNDHIESSRGHQCHHCEENR